MADRFYSGQLDYVARLNELASPDEINTSVASLVTNISNISSTATTARDQAVAAWAASTAPAEQLASFSPSIHVGAIVKAIIYDTSKDSDGGAWRKRCTDKSWYTETLGGNRWIGQQATIAAAWTAAGSATGAVFLASTTAGPLTIGKYYAATSATTATEVTRGISREFPALPLVVAETGRVVIYDGSQASCPMWMVFLNGLGGYMRGTIPSSLAAMNGQLLVGHGDAIVGVSFVYDKGWRSNTGGTNWYIQPIASRNTTITIGPVYLSSSIVNSIVNDVAITVLDTAPTDPATGLPVPTIAVATAGGVSVIKDDGTVVNSGATGSVASVWVYGASRIAYNPSGSLQLGVDLVGIAGSFSGTIISASATDFSVSYGPKLAGSGSVLASGGGDPFMSLTRLNHSNIKKGMTARVTNAYTSGWQVGDSRLAALADTTAETITATELVTNGGPFTTTTGWSAINATLSTSSNNLVLTSTVTTGGSLQAYTPFTTVIGKTYRASAQLIGVSGAAFNSTNLKATDNGLTQIQQTTVANTSAQTITVTFVATSTTSNIVIRVDSTLLTLTDTATWNNISVKLADADRSVKNNGLNIVGSLTKTAVASGAGLVAYSGFSANTNYLSQPYSTNLDFSTGDFAFGFWTDATAAGVLFTRGNGTSAGSVMWYQNGGGLTAALYIHDGTSLTPRITVTLPVGLSNIWITRSGTTLSVYSNGVLLGTATSALTVSNATAILQIGNRQDASQTYGGWVSLFRVSATAPSADQIAHIYRTELPLFQANAQCTIAGTSTAVTALAYDDVADTLQVGTSWGRTSFRDLLRIDSEATTTGAITSLSANEGVVLTGGASSGKVYAPAMYLRDELRRNDVARKALGRLVISQEFTATASQTVFTVRKGYDVKFVYVNGLLKRSVIDYNVTDDGFQETVTMLSGVPVGQAVTLMIVRG